MSDLFTVAIIGASMTVFCFILFGELRERMRNRKHVRESRKYAEMLREEKAIMPEPRRSIYMQNQIIKGEEK